MQEPMPDEDLERAEKLREDQFRKFRAILLQRAKRSFSPYLPDEVRPDLPTMWNDGRVEDVSTDRWITELCSSPAGGKMISDVALNRASVEIFRNWLVGQYIDQQAEKLFDAGAEIGDLL